MVTWRNSVAATSEVQEKERAGRGNVERCQQWTRMSQWMISHDGDLQCYTLTTLPGNTPMHLEAVVGRCRFR